MNADKYQELAMRTRGALSNEDALVNACLGLSGEVGEFVDHIKKHLFQGHPLDKAYLKKELGDIEWYCALGASAIEEKLSDIMVDNITKLEERYPDGFEKEKSINRKK